jgi:hypothetical protein
MHENCAALLKLLVLRKCLVVDIWSATDLNIDGCSKLKYNILEVNR